jgi:hypothetical protein
MLLCHSLLWRVDLAETVASLALLAARNNASSPPVIYELPDAHCNPISPLPMSPPPLSSLSARLFY